MGGGERRAASPAAGDVGCVAATVHVGVWTSAALQRLDVGRNVGCFAVTGLVEM